MNRSVWLMAMALSTCWIAALAAPMATEVDVQVGDPQLPGCLYNDQLYNEGETVPTKETCLNCSCRQGALRCHLQVCPYTHELYPPPVGCILVERKGACCPKLHCPDKVGENGLARKDPSGQISSWKLRDDMRRRLVKQISRHASDKQGCVEGGTAYADGSGMMSSSTCEYCFCLKGKQTCVKPRCRTPLGKEGCVPKYRPMVCCPVLYDCDAQTKNGTAVEDQHAWPLMTSQATNIRGNDRVIDSPTPSFVQKQTVRRRRAAAEADEAVQANTEVNPQAETDKEDAESATDVPAEVPRPADVEVKKQVEKPVEEVKMDATATKSTEADLAAPERVEDPEPKPTKVEDPEPKPTKAEDPEPKPAKVEDPEPKPEKAEDPEPKPAKVEDPEPKPEKAEDPEPKPMKVDDPEPKPETVEEPAAKPEKAEDPEPKPMKMEDPEPKPEKTEDPEPKPMKMEDPEPKPEKLEEPAAKPEKTEDPEPNPVKVEDSELKPEESAEPDSKADEPAAKPDESADPVAQPEESAQVVSKPDETADVDTAEDRIETGDPEDELDAEGAERAIQVSVSSSVTSVTGQKVDGPSKETSRTAQDVSQEKRISSVSVNVTVQEAPANNTSDTEEDAAIAEEPEEVDESVSEEPKVDEPAASSQKPPLQNFVPSQAAEDPETVEDQDYDYQHMELPPSLPNLEIIPFVAADAVVGHPNEDLDDDERLNLGGVADQRTPISQLSPTGDKPSTTEYCFVDGGFYSHGELISKPDPCVLCRCNLGRVMCTETQCAPLPDGCHRKQRPGFCCGQVVCGAGAEEDNSDSAEVRDDVRPLAEEKPREGTTSTTISPLLAFRVTFPPRPSSTLPSSPSPAFIRFPTKRLTTTQRPTPPPSTHRTKFNKPAAANNLLASSFATGGLKVDSCNIYGQVYRVGRIIEELSGPCVECKCTEIGVNCFPLKC